MNLALDDQVAVVTGASRGIGAAIARGLAGAGAYVAVNYHTHAAEAHAVVEDIRAHGGQAEAVGFDVSDDQAVKDCFKDLAQRHGHIDILVNNAGIAKDNLLLRFKGDDFDQVVQTNLKGAFICAFHASRSMLKQHRGRIINISSVVGLGGNAGQAVYAATKAGLIGLTKSLAKELGSRGILVNAIAPGLIETDMSSGVDMKALEGNIPLGRIGRPQDVAGAALFLCSDLSAYITGQVIIVDGGLYA
ncbi:MAG TPA: 3-oxoacyl-[acyl-carrier-protein] reductase [Deltaproteobacteria bacterium]|nr:3-oxoacyl-[acyl-carrier-protein] reductase [Deltaproteobacteria bacterium]